MGLQFQRDSYFVRLALISGIYQEQAVREREAYGSFLHSVTLSLPGERSVLEIKHHETCKTSFFDS